MREKPLNSKIICICNLLYREFGPQGWWPLTSMAGKPGFDKAGYHKGDHSYPRTDSQRWEIVLGAILTQNTSWKNAQKALENLKVHGVLDRNSLKRLSENGIAVLIKSSGYHTQKAKKIKAYLAFSGEITRESLLEIWGVGAETGDSILLYAYKEPVFVIDAYTKRIMERVGYGGRDYDGLQRLFMGNLPSEYKTFNEYHALLVELGKRNCLKNKPKCKECPLVLLCGYGKNSKTFI